MFPKTITDFGIQSDWSGDNFVIYFGSRFNSKFMYLADGCVTANLDEAIANDSMDDTIEALGELLQDKEFIEYLEGEFVF